MFMNRYKEIIRNKTIEDNFYSKLKYDTQQRRITLHNDKNEDVLELFKGESLKTKDQNLIGETKFKNIIKELSLTPLYT